ncbi:MAG TPA: phosphoadenylyl-sulfate reductase [Jatrophihabitans sp.]|jgi:phosphoadenosine phosphosulfate reductase|uniref:phosphoadenylyl-sulfate reductase n=1 Tax=Jatrophihabitans sp. TaxID=1932789 RepID=UPI002E02B033|nr:phosphoadenylyl-sulfate reductase [Jatrophihabitans sp.]
MVALSTREELRDLAERAGRDLEGASALEILGWADGQFGSSWAVASSMADAVLPSLAAKVRPGVDILFLDTGYHFAETIGTRDAVAATLPVTIKTIEPRQTVAEQDASFGARLYERNPDQCCALRKVMPLRKALRDYTAWASGLRRDEASTRKDVKVVEWDDQRSMVKLNPIAAWNQDDVDIYMSENGILVNPLLFDGYGSVGCAPCTRRIAPGEDARAGRWSGSNKVECGLH